MDEVRKYESKDIIYLDFKDIKSLLSGSFVDTQDKVIILTEACRNQGMKLGEK